MKERRCCPLLEVIVTREREEIEEGEASDMWKRTKERGGERFLSAFSCPGV